MGASMDGKSAGIVRRLTALILLSFALAPRAHSAVVEISGMASYSTSKFNNDVTSVSRRYTASVDLKFTAVSAIEFEYTDELSQYSFPSDLGLLANPTKEQESYKDTIYSLNWVQNLVSAKYFLQPYFVIGGGRMTRKVTMSLPEFGYGQTTTQNVFTGTGGVGLRLFLTKSMALKGELKTYVPNFQFAKWRDNEAFSAGLSWSF
jgi:hypothetical protein